MKSTVTVDVGEGVDPFSRNTPARSRIRAFAALLKTVIGGGLNSRTSQRPTIRAGTAQASGTVTIASGSGAITVTINGVTAASETWATSDAATAAALAADINASADALVSGHVTAAAEDGVLTVTAKSKGVEGNAITLAASGTGATASGARLTGGTSTTFTF